MHMRDAKDINEDFNIVIVSQVMLWQEPTIDAFNHPR